MLRAILPLLLFLLVIHSKYLHPSTPLPSSSPSLACPLNSNQLDALSHIYTCPLGTVQNQSWLVGGVLSTPPRDAEAQIIQQGMQEWGILTS